jgi:hypothetical protein
LEDTPAGTFWADNIGHLSTRPVSGRERITVDLLAFDGPEFPSASWSVVRAE